MGNFILQQQFSQLTLIRSYSMPVMVGFVLAMAFVVAQAQQMQSNISRGSSLTPTTNSSWLSRSGVYAFGFYKQGNGYAVGIFLAGIPQTTIVWTAKRDDPPLSTNVTLDFTSDGFSLTSTQGQSFVMEYTSGSSASMLDSGNFVIYNARQDIVWQSFKHPTDTLLPGQTLFAEDELFSAKSESDHSTGIFRLKMQADGNLVQYPVNTPDTAPYSYYSSGTDGRGKNVTLHFAADGHLYLLNDTYSNIRNITNGGLPADQATIYLMRIDADGIFRLFSHDLNHNGRRSMVWESSNDKCDPKGVCGLNSYCVLLDLEAECRCLPGFESANQRNKTSGCSRNLVADGCEHKNETLKYTMEELESTTWEDISYVDLTLSDKEACKRACLEDCNCEAALFDDTSCKKQRLPLRYGRRQVSTSNVALIKVAKSTTTPDTNRIVEKGSKRKGRTDILIISLSLAAFGSILFAISVVVLCKHIVWAYKRVNTLIRDSELNEDIALQPYTYEELEKITNNFTEEVGRGASGTVYKGVILASQKPVAVKRLEKVAAEGEKEFQTELKVIGKTHHKNLVRLLGYCLDGPKRLLVYEYMSNGSLADVLFAPDRQPCWEERMRIARNIARGFLYLHEECDTQIIHCDIKPQNILMDEYMCPKISDFGLAKLLKADQTRTTTGIRGTKGYVAPEWHRKMPITVKADVYSFGIVLLEIICCRRNVDWSLPEEEAVLDELAYPCFESGELGKLVGEQEVDTRQFERMIKVALWCVQDEPSLRPSMKKVLLMLEGTVEIPIPPSPNSILSTI
ncbi:G-type lectin S-receptor-like serine/threonine-protein kinase RLK1 [Pyrus ussuriensis x Pyrus communis]|uniref:Receptor-like serine/threonine-protein kinase n=1 Tax=Pyrus ussuriensis x Pyrus communis TaxID=2448454 RepID=A0A5N5H1K8_9ROSA|nr:G-type lectin S-receptor-like serine/threonine-protein kinase RLK1 [Pyrus ussuriensis x Pyrus communis]